MASPGKRRVFLREPPDGARVERAVSALMEIPGVLSVFLGAPSKRGRRYLRGYALCVRVARKGEAVPGEPYVPIPAEVEGIPTDVEAIGLPSAHAVCAGQPAGVRVSDPSDRRTPGTLTAVTAGGEALLSGHASLPYRRGAILREYDGGPAPVLLGDAFGELSGGRLGPREDWARARLVAVVEAVHPLVGVAPPFSCAQAVQGTVLRQLSRLAGACRGRVTSMGANVPMPLRLPDGSTHTYAGVYEVEPLGAPAFSSPGDSGSLVCDGLGRAVGVVVGGSDRQHRSYVLPVVVEPPFFVG